MGVVTTFPDGRVRPYAEPNSRSAPSELKAKENRAVPDREDTVQVRPRRSPAMTSSSSVLHPVVARIRASSARNCRAQSAQQKNRRSPSTSSQWSPQVESQIAQPE